MGLFAEEKLIVAALLSELERGRVIRRPGSILLKGLRELSGKGRISPISVMDSIPAPPSDWAVNAKYFALTYHPGGGDHEGYPRKLDDAAYWVLQVGLQMDVDRRILSWLQLRGSGALYKDCADVWAGYVHLGPRLEWTPVERLSLRFGIGPTYLWRENWLYHVPGYTHDGFFGRPDSSQNWQTSFLWYGGDLEVQWRFDRKWSAVASVVPGWPQVVTTSVGLRREF